MKQLFSIICITILLVSCGGSQKSSTITKTQASVNAANPAEYATSITSDELKELLYKYASDEFEGRDTGSKGQKLAVEYIKAQYQAMGVPSPLSAENYFQKVPFEKQKVAQAKLTVNGKAFNSFEHHVVLALSTSMDLAIEDIMYVGYGIDDENYSDYKNKDVKGKIVLVKAGEPKDENGNYITTGQPEDTKWTNGRQSIASKREAAKTNGAKGLLLMDANLFPRYAPFYQRQAESGVAGRLALKSDQDDFVFLMINEDLAKALHPSISEDSTPKMLNVKMTLNVENNAENIESENVLAFIKGSEYPDEILVLSAHLDHEGIKDGEIYNGADDDGSGTVALIEIAEAFKMAENAGHGPKRSILFLHVTAEEKGLLGSRYYTDVEPVFPLENTVANLNIDMIGRIDPKREGDRNYIYLIGSDKLSTELHNISEEVNKKYMNVMLDYTYNDENDPNRYYYRSDHYNFVKNNIPIIFYFNGTHDDYHRPSDTPDKIEYDLLENRTRLVFHTAWEVANRDKRIIADKAENK
jgi:hypothetical protein